MYRVVDYENELKVKKKVGTFFISLTDSCATIYFLLGQLDDGKWATYRVDTTKALTTNDEKTHQYEYEIDEEKIYQRVKEFIENIETISIDYRDVAYKNRYSKSFTIDCIKDIRVDLNVLKSWYLKNRLQTKELQNIIIEGKAGIDTVPTIKQSDLEVGKIYVDSGCKHKYVYVGKFREQYVFKEITSFNNDEVIVAKNMIFRYGYKHVKTLPKLYLLDTYPERYMLDSGLAYKNNWYQKKLNVKYVLAYRIRFEGTCNLSGIVDGSSPEEALNNFMQKKGLMFQVASDFTGTIAVVSDWETDKELKSFYLAVRGRK